MSLYCPYTQTCPFYQNWSNQTKNRRIDVIISEGEGEDYHYDCLTLMAIIDPITEGGILIGKKLKKQLPNPKSAQGVACSHLALLNNSLNLEDKLNDIIDLLEKKNA